MHVLQEKTLERVLGHPTISRLDREEQPDKVPKTGEWLVRQKENKKRQNKAAPRDLQA